jgi:hypothetical protein
MAKTKKIDQIKPRVNYPINILPRDNTKKTLPLWRQARDSAESIYYPVRKPLMDLYREVVTDPHVVNCIEKRINAITNCTWAFMQDGEEVEAFQPILRKKAFERLLKYILESKLYGHSLIECGNIINNVVELVPREHVLPQYNVVIADPYVVSEGIDYTAPPYNATTLAVGEPEDLGLLYNITPYVLFKKGDIGDWATYCEVFGAPLRVGKYDPAIPGNEAAVSNGLKGMGSMAWAALPIGSEFEFVEASKGTGNNVYESFANFCDDQIAIGLVGQTMTSKDGSSQAQASVHMEVLEDIHMADRRFVEKTLNEDLIPILIAQGFSIPPDAEFTIIDEEETLTKKDRLEMDLRIHKEVRPIKEDYFAQEYNIEFDEAQPSRAESAAAAAASSTPKASGSLSKGATAGHEKPGKVVSSSGAENLLDTLKSFFQ